jgi:hypothetical protein
MYTLLYTSHGGVALQIDKLKTGGFIELEIKYKGKYMSFKSDIVLVRNNSVLITAIKVNGQTVGFSDNFIINFLYKFKGRLYLWDNVIVKLVRYNGSIYHMIQLSGEGITHNRRDAYRMYIGEDMLIYVNTPTGPSALSVLIKDISETGFGFLSKNDFDINRIIRLRLQDNSKIVSISSMIVRKEYLSNLGTFLYGCRFNEKNNYLPKYIARKQAEILKLKATPLMSIRDYNIKES